MLRLKLNIQEVIPLVIFDNACHLCIKFAQGVNFLARGKIRLVGHYTSMGKKLRDEFLEPQATEMFWFIDGENAYGGRAALMPLFFAILKGKGNNFIQKTIEENCDVGCKAPGAVFIRSASLFTNSRKIKLK